MRETVPTVYLISRPSIDIAAMEAYLLDVGGMEWANRVIYGQNDASDAEILLEFAGRACYRSWAPGLNVNVTKVREDSEEYLGNVIRSGHGSVLEHANFTFAIRNVSRVFTHELVRHRVGLAISQESLRYVRLTDLGFRVPDVLAPIRSQVISSRPWRSSRSPPLSNSDSTRRGFPSTSRRRSRLRCAGWPPSD